MVPLAHVSPVHSLARNFLIEGITRATAYESERGGRLIVLNNFIYIRFLIFELYDREPKFITG